MPVSISGDGTFAGLTSVETVDLRHPDAVAANITLGADGSVPLDAANIASGTVDTARLPALGKVLQVVSVVKNDSFTTGSLSFIDVTGLAASITPSSVNSKVLIMANVAVGGGDQIASLLLTTGANVAIIPPNTGTHEDASLPFGTTTLIRNSIIALHSPSTTSSITYKIRLKNNDSLRSSRVNSRASGSVNAASTITLMEIGA